MSQLYVITDSGDFDCATSAEIEACGYTRNSEVLRLCEMSESALQSMKVEVEAMIAFEPVVRELLAIACYATKDCNDADYERLEAAVDAMYADSPKLTES